MSNPLIKVSGLSKIFGPIIALSDVTFNVNAGEVLGVIGPTAAGKTVLLKCLIGLMKPSRGSIEIAGYNVADPKNRLHLADRIGMLFQQNALFDSLPVWENIAFRALHAGQKRVDAYRAVCELLPQVGLNEGTADLFPSDLSGGMQKRVGFARAIFTQPDILFLDNPTAGIDPILAARIEKMIQTMARARQTTVISVTSSLTHLSDYYDRVAVLVDGVMQWQGPAQSIRNEDNPYVVQLLSGSRDGPIKTRTAA